MRFPVANLQFLRTPRRGPSSSRPAAQARIPSSAILTPGLCRGTARERDPRRADAGRGEASLLDCLARAAFLMGDAGRCGEYGRDSCGRSGRAAVCDVMGARVGQSGRAVAGAAVRDGAASTFDTSRLYFIKYPKQASRARRKLPSTRAASSAIRDRERTMPDQVAVH